MFYRTTSFHLTQIYLFISYLFNICLLFIILVAFNTTAFSAEKQTLRVGLFQNKPAVFQNEKGEPQGIYIDLVNEVARQEKWQVDYVLDSWAGSLQRLSSGDIDVMTSISYSLERDRFADFTHESVWGTWGVVAVPVRSSIHEVKDLDGKNVAVVGREISGINFIKLTQNFKINSRILSLSSYDEVLKAVSEGRADAGVVNNLFGTKHISAYGLKGSSIIFSPVNGFFAVPEGKHKDIVVTIDRYMKQWKHEPDSIYYKSLNRWLGNQPDKTFVLPRWVYVGFSIVATVILMLFVWTYLLKRMVNLKTRELQKSEERLRELFDQSPIGLMLCNLQGTFVAANKAFAQIVGLDLDVVLARRYWDMVPEQYLVQEKQRWKDLHRFGHCEPCDMELNHSDGHLVPVHRHTMIVERDDECLIWSSTEDISILKRVEADREELSEQLQQKQKMEAIGTLAGGIAHDFNNILSAIFGYTEQALQDPHCVPPVSSKLKLALSAASRAKKLVQQILTYSRKGADKRQPLVLHSAVLDSCNLLVKTIPASVQFKLDIDDSTGVVMADSNQIHQIVMNLCTNAYHALEDKDGEICVSLKPIHVDPEQEKKYSDLAPGDYASLRVRDTGVGISGENTSRIFDPFFTTKKRGEGTGLGLSVVHGIVQSHQGSIRSDSTLGEGTTFEVLLPLISKKGHVSSCEVDFIGVSDENLRGHEHILFVDDEPMLVDLMKGTLATFGYQVTACSSAEVALGFFQADPYGYDLVLTDQVMPGMTGDVLAQSVLNLRDDIPIIICTGHSFTMDAEKIAEIGVRKLLMKPLTNKVLLKSIRATLDESDMAEEGIDSPGQAFRGASDDEYIQTISDVNDLKKDFLQLPEPLRQQLQEALRSWSPDRIDDAIDDIRQRNQLIAEALDLWANDFRYDQLQKLYDL